MSVRERVREHRRRLREQGLRPVQVWVPDVRSEQFEGEARRQSQSVADANSKSDSQDFIESVSASWGDE